MKLVVKGFESPIYNTNVISNTRTEIKLPGEGISYNWKPSDGKDDSKFWSNVEYNKYGNTEGYGEGDTYKSNNPSK